MDSLPTTLPTLLRYSQPIYRYVHLCEAYPLEYHQLALRYLEQLWTHLHPSQPARRFNSVTVPIIHQDVPAQPSYYDCGAHLLNSVECFLFGSAANSLKGTSIRDDIDDVVSGTLSAASFCLSGTADYPSSDGQPLVTRQRIRRYDSMCRELDLYAPCPTHNCIRSL